MDGHFELTVVPNWACGPAKKIPGGHPKKSSVPSGDLYENFQNGFSYLYVCKNVWHKGVLETRSLALGLEKGGASTMVSILRDAGLSALVVEGDVETLAGGFQFTEGPLKLPYCTLLFQDMQANRTPPDRA